MLTFIFNISSIHGEIEINWQAEEGVTRSIKHAKEFFLYDAESYFSHHKIWFKTLYRQESGVVTEALVMPPRKGATDSFSMILPKRVQPPTHQVTNPQDGKNYYVRLTVEVRDRGYFDPFDYRFGKSVLANLDPSMLSFSNHVSHHTITPFACKSLQMPNAVAIR